MSAIFPDHPDRVFADWVTGKLRAVRGEMLYYVHAGYGSSYEQDFFFEISKGILKSVEIVDNTSDKDGDT